MWSIASLMVDSLTLHPKWFQLFQPMGGVEIFTPCAVSEMGRGQ